jgi:predicted nucleic acid-binding protein
VERIFLDANVLFSAAYLENSGLGRLWRLDGIALSSSAYAVEQARRNLILSRKAALTRFEQLVSKLMLSDPPVGVKFPASVRLEAKDRPILLSAIQGEAYFLLTGDARHFGHLYGRRVQGVMVLRPAQYLEWRVRA